MKTLKKWIIFLAVAVLSVIAIIKLPTYAVTSSSLTGRVIFIDPGHGGKDDGASRSGVVEDEINLHIASYLLEQCMENGAKAIITRTGDYDLASLYATNRKREDLAKRVSHINESGANFFISLHVNALNNEAVNGPMVYYKKNCDTSLAIGQSVAKELNEFSGKDKPLHAEDYYLFKKTTIPGILVECGFLSNTQERNKLINSNYQNEISKAICLGIINYFKGIRI